MAHLFIQRQTGSQNYLPKNLSLILAPLPNISKLVRNCVLPHLIMAIYLACALSSLQAHLYQPLDLIIFTINGNLIYALPLSLAAQIFWAVLWAAVPSALSIVASAKNAFLAWQSPSITKTASLLQARRASLFAPRRIPPCQSLSGMMKMAAAITKPILRNMIISGITAIALH